MSSQLPQLLKLLPLLPLSKSSSVPPSCFSNCSTANMYRLQYCAAVSKQRLLSHRSSSSAVAALGCWMHCKLVIVEWFDGCRTQQQASYT
jgi:hypothetical protein